jgi:hypothetical protein
MMTTMEMMLMQMMQGTMMVMMTVTSDALSTQSQCAAQRRLQ